MPRLLPIAARTLLAAAGLALAAGCGDDPVGPRPLSGVWMLEAYDDSPPPIILGTSWTVPTDGGASVRCDLALVGMTLAFDGAAASMTELVDRTCGGDIVEIRSTTVTGTQRADGDRIVITLPRTQEGVVETRLIARRAGGAIIVDRREYQGEDGPMTIDETELIFAPAPVP